MDVTLLYFDDCPSWHEADRNLRAVAQEWSDITVSYQKVGNVADAERWQFRGSPSLHLDGVDLFADAGDPVGLCCRVYPTPTGLAGAPTEQQIRQALIRKIERRNARAHDESTRNSG